MNTGEALFHAVLDNPDDRDTRSVYADWLQEHGDARGDYLRLLLEMQALPDNDPGRAECRARTRLLRPSIDRHWAAVIDDFDARVREVRTMHLKIATHGRAPKKYPMAYKIRKELQNFLVDSGWEHVGSGRSYAYFRPPAGAKAASLVNTFEVPTDAELLRLAESFHRAGKPTGFILGSWMVFYLPSAGGDCIFRFISAAPWRFCLRWRGGKADPELVQGDHAWFED